MSIHENSLPSCIHTYIEMIISLSIQGLVFILGFALSVLVIQSLMSYKPINPQYTGTLKLTLTLYILAFWMLFISASVIHLYCIKANVVKNRVQIMDSNYVIYIQLGFLLVMIIQLVFVQINSMKITQRIVSNTKYPLKTRYLIVSIWFTSVSTILLLISTLFYYGSYMDQFQELKEYVVITLPLGILFAIGSHFIMLYRFVRTLFLIIYDHKVIARQTTSYYDSEYKESKQTNSITPLNDSHVSSKTPTTLGQTPETNNVNSRYSEYHTSTSNENRYLNNPMNRIMKSISKLITVTLFAYIFMCVPAICCILVVIFSHYNNLLTLIIGHIFIISSMFSVLYMYLHFSFSDEFYYNKLKCCVNIDTILRNKISLMVEHKIHKNETTSTLLLK